MPTKTPKTKKPATKESAANSKESPAKAKVAKGAKTAKAAEPVRPPPSQSDGDGEGDGDEDDDDDEDVPAKPAAKPAAKAKPPEDAQPIVPARRLTPEAKARVNEMVKKGMSLTDALRAAASWETFVAPIKTAEEQQPGKPGGPHRGGFDGTPRPRPPMDDDETEESIAPESDD